MNDNFVQNYLKKADWQIKENSNTTFSAQGLNHYVAGNVVREYCLNEVYPKKIADAHRGGDIYIHDLSNGICNYCCGWDLLDLLTAGFTGAAGKIQSKPARHLRTALLHAVNFTFSLANESSGAMAFSNFDTLMSAFIRSDNITYEELKQDLQEYVFNMNVPTRTAGQPPFSNISLDVTIPEHYRELPAIVGGKPQSFCYGDLQEEVNMFNRAFSEILLEGDAAGRPFSFPIPTISITDDFDWDNKNHEFMWKATAKYGPFYYRNFCGSDMDPNDIYSFCCRLSIDKKELKNRGGGIFGCDSATGAIGICTINLPRIGHLAKDKDEFYRRLKENMVLAKEGLEIKRNLLENLAEIDLYPYSRFYLRSTKEMSGKFFDNNFSIIGVIGMNDAIYNLLGISIETEEGLKFAKDVLLFMREVISEFQNETNNLYALEETPAESACYNLALKDKEKFGESIKFYNIDFGDGEVEYYTNSSHIPVMSNMNLFEMLEHQSQLQPIYNSGSVSHIFLGEKAPDAYSVKELVKFVANNYEMPYFSITPTFSVCKTHNYLFGEHKLCPHCGEKCEVYSRVTGFIRPTSQWNIGKTSEFGDRKTFDRDLTLPAA